MCEYVHLTHGSNKDSSIPKLGFLAVQEKNYGSSHRLSHQKLLLLCVISHLCLAQQTKSKSHGLVSRITSAFAPDNGQWFRTNYF